MAPDMLFFLLSCFFLDIEYLGVQMVLGFLEGFEVFIYCGGEGALKFYLKE